jgi:hypothetical protein
MEWLKILGLANPDQDRGDTAIEIFNETNYDAFKGAMGKNNSDHSLRLDAGDYWQAIYNGILKSKDYVMFPGEKNVSDTTTTTTTDTTASGSTTTSAAKVDTAETIRLAEEASKRASDFNLMLGRTLGPEILDQTTDTAKALDASLQAEMDRLYPGMRQSTAQYSKEALDATRKAAAEFSTGNVPQDVQDYQQRLAASLGISRGAFGTAPNYGLARNLGATSLQMKQYGTQLYAGIPTMSAQILQNARSTMPAMNQLPQMYDSAYARAFAASAMDTGALTSIISSGMEQNARLTQDQNQFNTTLDWTKYLSEITRADEKERNDKLLALYYEQIKSGNSNAKMNAWSTIGGAGIGAIGNMFKSTPSKPGGTPTETPSNTSSSGYGTPYNSSVFPSSSTFLNTNGSPSIFSSYSNTFNDDIQTNFPDSSLNSLPNTEFLLWLDDLNDQDDEDEQ